MKYNFEELDKLVNDWIKFQYEMQNVKLQEDKDKIVCYDMELLDFCIIPKLPKLALSIILRIIEQDSSDYIIPVLAAGELEDLLTIHGEKLINDIEDIANKNIKFKKLLGGVWQGDMPDELYLKITDIIGGEKNRW